MYPTKMLLTRISDELYDETLRPCNGGGNQSHKLSYDSGGPRRLWQLPRDQSVSQISQTSNSVQQDSGKSVCCGRFTGELVHSGRHSQVCWFKQWVKQNHQVLCISSAIICFFLISVIILHLALISVERFIAVKWALRYHVIVTNHRAMIACIGMWLWGVAVVFLFPNAMTAGSSDDFDHFRQAIHPCSCSHDGPLAHHHLAPSTKGYLVFLMISLMIIPLMIIVFSYGYTFVVSQRHRKEIRELGDIPGMAVFKREMKGARTLAILVAVCLISIIPLLVVTCLRFSGVPPKRKNVKFIVFDVARGLNAICNPFIYGWRNKELRRAFCKLLKCSK